MRLRDIRSRVEQLLAAAEEPASDQRPEPAAVHAAISGLEDYRFTPALALLGAHPGERSLRELLAASAAVGAERALQTQLPLIERCLSSLGALDEDQGIDELALPEVLQASSAEQLRLALTAVARCGRELPEAELHRLAERAVRAQVARVAAGALGRRGLRQLRSALGAKEYARLRAQMRAALELDGTALTRRLRAALSDARVWRAAFEAQAASEDQDCTERVRVALRDAVIHVALNS